MNRFSSFLLAPALVVCGALLPDSSEPQEPSETLRVHYLEIVTADRDATCELLEKVHGVTFGEPVQALGNARTAPLAGGGTLGVRAPMHGAEESVVRPYLGVDDLEAAVAEAVAQKGEVAVEPTELPDVGRFAIYFHGGIQYGLWKN
jgi:predicted enzyme related to lactoylglutathione lyase